MKNFLLSFLLVWTMTLPGNHALATDTKEALKEKVSSTAKQLSEDILAFLNESGEPFVREKILPHIKVAFEYFNENVPLADYPKTLEGQLEVYDAETLALYTRDSYKKTPLSSGEAQIDAFYGMAENSSYVVIYNNGERFQIKLDIVEDFPSTLLQVSGETLRRGKIIWAVPEDEMRAVLIAYTKSKQDITPLSVRFYLGAKEVARYTLKEENDMVIRNEQLFEKHVMIDNMN